MKMLKNIGVSLAVIGLAVRDARSMAQGEGEAGARPGIVMGDQIAQIVIQFRSRVHPEGEREITLADRQGGSPRDRDLRGATVEPGVGGDGTTRVKG